MDINLAIRSAVDTGEVLLGERETLKALRNKGIKLAVVAKNCPQDLRDDLEKFGKMTDVSVYEFNGTSLELGAICGKPYVISMLGVISAGDSDIFELGRR